MGAVTNTWVAGDVQGRHYNTIAAQLRKLGFYKSHGWSSNYYHKTIHTNVPGWDNTNHLKVEVTLYNRAWTGHNWYVEKVSIDGRMNISGPDNELTTLLMQLAPLQELDIKE